MVTMTDKLGIYIHVPFCLSKCYYCDFCSETRVDFQKAQAYTDAVCREISFIAQKLNESGKSALIADTVYFGGGTPVLLGEKQFEQILSSVRKNFPVSEDCEITVEANPKSADKQKLFTLKELGVNRLSIGMQSANDNELRALGRIHCFADFCKIFDDARQVGFDNVSADLMYGIPEQTLDSFCHSIDALTSMSPEHISSYCLTLEENTRFYKRGNSLILPNEDTVSDMYGIMSEKLAEKGYQKYEISNFSRIGRESRHNNKYWTLENYIGFGPSAHSCFDGVRFAHSRDIDAYINGENTFEQIDKINISQQMNEYVMLGMRLKRGIIYSEFKTRFGVDFIARFRDFEKFAPEFVQINENNCAFTDKGMFVSNYILSEVLDFS